MTFRCWSKWINRRNFFLGEKNLFQSDVVSGMFQNGSGSDLCFWNTQKGLFRPFFFFYDGDSRLFCVFHEWAELGVEMIYDHFGLLVQGGGLKCFWKKICLTRSPSFFRYRKVAGTVSRGNVADGSIRANKSTKNDTTFKPFLTIRNEFKVNLFYTNR